MPVDRTLWKHPPFGSLDPMRHTWRCPSCARGALDLKKETLHFAETLQSHKAREEEDWNPIDYYKSFRFAGILKCNSRRCSEVVVIAGLRSNSIEISSWTDPDTGESEDEDHEVEN